VTGIYCAQNGTPQGEVRGFLWTPQLGAVDLGLPPGVTDPTTIVKPFGINARGQIVGEVANSSFDDDFVWDRSGFTLIAADAQALAINNPGQVTGRLYSPGHAFLYSNGAVMDLGVGVPGATESGGDAINNLGHIAGWAGIPAPAPAYVSIVPMVWTGAAWRVLGKPIAGNDYAYQSSINNFDEIVGVSNSNNSPMHAFLWKDGVYTVLPCLPDQYCAASSINDAGTIVGATNTVGVIWFAFYGPALHRARRLCGHSWTSKIELVTSDPDPMNDYGKFASHGDCGALHASRSPGVTPPDAAR